MEPSCAICLEIPTIGYSLQCGHKFCLSCVEHWFEFQESCPSTTALTCPHCREVVGESDVLAVLRRPVRLDSNDHSAGNFHEVSAAAASSASEGPDEFTLSFLAEQGARQCPDCGVWIILEDGCNNVMCRCGCRFCYCCGAKGSHDGGGTFFDNVVMEEEDRSYDWDPDNESVAGAVVPLFEGDPFYDFDWLDVWCDNTEIEDEPLVPLFDERLDWYGEWFRDLEEYEFYPLVSLFDESNGWYDVWFEPLEEYWCEIYTSDDFAPLFDEDQGWYDVWFRHLEEHWEELQPCHNYQIIPLFEGGSDSPWFLQEEQEPTRIAPLFCKDWNIDGCLETAPEEVRDISIFWKTAMMPSDGSDNEEDYGASLFGFFTPPTTATTTA